MINYKKKIKYCVFTFYQNFFQKIILSNIIIFLNKNSEYYHYKKHNKKTIRRIKEKVRNGKKIRVCFFVMLDSVFAAKPLLDAMLKDDLFEPFIVVIPDISRGEQHMESSCKQAYDSLSQKYPTVLKGYENGKFYDYSDGVDMFYFPTPYVGITYKYFEIEYFLNKEALLFYINYAYSVLKFVREVISLPTYNYFWKVFVENKNNIYELKKYQLLGGKNAVVSGYCKMDELVEQKAVIRDRKRIIIAPHHTIFDWNLLNISNFLKYHDFFLKLPRLYPDIDFVFRPHPLLIVQLKKPEFWGEEKTTVYFEELEKYPNVTYSRGGEYFNIFANSDGIIHDCGSFLAEYLFTGKPACYMLKDEKSIKEWFLPIGQRCLDHCYRAYSEKDITDYIENVIIKGDDFLSKKRVDFVNSELKINYPKASQFILNYIKKRLIL